MDILHKIGRPKIVARCRVGPKSFLSRNEWAAPPKIEVLNIPRQDIDPISSFGISRWDYFGKQYLCIFWRYLDSFQTSQEYPCRDSSTAEYNVCALIMFRKNMAPPSEVAPFSKTAPCRGGAVLLNLPKKVKVVLFWLHPWHHFDSTPGTVGLSKG